MRPFFSLFPSEPSVARVLHAKLSLLPALAGMEVRTLARISAECCWFALPGEVALPAQKGALYLVLTGRIGQVLAGRLAAEIAPGAAFMPQEGSTFVALRDCEVLEIAPRGLEILAARHPKQMLALMTAMAERSLTWPRPPLHKTQAKPKTIAFVPLQEGLGDEPLVPMLAEALGALGSKAGVLDHSHAAGTAEFFSAFEAGHDLVLYRGDYPGSAFTARALRQADRVYLVARADRPLPQKLPVTGNGHGGKPDLILLHSGPVAGRLPDHPLFRQDRLEACHHLRRDRAADLARLARCVSGRAVGLVLGGGGARGFAHIGIAKALCEAGIAFDYLGGVSMGAIAAAGLALEWSVEELEARLREAFVNTQPLSDYTLPLIALAKGRKMSRLLSSHFGRSRIEDLPRPFFCISADLTSGHIHEHREGPLWRALRSSAALPGIVPPVTWRGHLLVDGGVMNNLPVDLMARRRIGLLIASDVTGEVDFSVRAPPEAVGNFWERFWPPRTRMPSIVDILMRTGTMGSEAQRKLVRDEADLLFAPEVGALNPLDWKSFDKAVAEGYSHACRLLDKTGIPKI